MNYKELIAKDKRGVSSVIGVILMVAITVILAATVGVYTLGFGENIEEVPPSMSFTCNENGDPVVQGTTSYQGTVVYEGHSYDNLSAGTVLDEGDNSGGPVIWESVDGDQSAILYKGC